MKILVGAVFGIGNSIMRIPMIKALHNLPDVRVDILVGGLPDDFGAFHILSKVNRPPAKVFIDSALEGDYDLAIMSMPFDGRWRNGVHFRAKEVWDGRTRPDPSTTGLVSWERHEIDYQMDHARRLGYTGPTPTTSFQSLGERTQDIYVGVGYKKDAAGFWKVKHWGNENFAQFIEMMLKNDPDCRIISTGNMSDFVECLRPIKNLVAPDLQRRIDFRPTTLQESIDAISRCRLYVGNDTGMMHVAASFGLPTLGLFFMGPQSVVKSAPRWDEKSSFQSYIEGDRMAITPKCVFDYLFDMGVI